MYTFQVLSQNYTPEASRFPWDKKQDEFHKLYCATEVTVEDFPLYMHGYASQEFDRILKGVD